MKLGWQQEKAW